MRVAVFSSKYYDRRFPSNAADALVTIKPGVKIIRAEGKTGDDLFLLRRGEVPCPHDRHWPPRRPKPRAQMRGNQIFESRLACDAQATVVQYRPLPGAAY